MTFKLTSPSGKEIELTKVGETITVDLLGAKELVFTYMGDGENANIEIIGGLSNSLDSDLTEQGQRLMIAQYLINAHKAETERFIKYSSPPHYLPGCVEQSQKRLTSIEVAMATAASCTPEGISNVGVIEKATAAEIEPIPRTVPDEHREAVDELTTVLNVLRSDGGYNKKVLVKRVEKVLAYLGEIY